MALLGLVALCAPVNGARQLTQMPAMMPAGVTDADILNFALNLEVNKCFYLARLFDPILLCLWLVNLYRSFLKLEALCVALA